MKITPQNFAFERDARELIAKEVRTYVQGKGRISHLATKATISPSTVSNLAYGETKKPRMHTVAGLLEALGYEVTINKRKPDK